MTDPPRLIDLRCDWLSQYAGETTVFDPSFYPGVGSRLGQAEGYLQGASASVLACHRDAREWANLPDPWGSLGDLIARVEAEFPGRLLIGPEDVVRWNDDPGGLCWGVLGVQGFDPLVRTTADLDRLPGLFDRGVRVFQAVDTAASVLAGSATAGDDRGLTDLGRAFLGVLAGLATVAVGPRPVLDLAGLNPASISDVLDWFEADEARARRLIPLHGRGALAHDGFDGPGAITAAHLARLRAMGGVIGFGIGPPFAASAEALKAGIEAAAGFPYKGQPGYQGIAIATGFLGVDRTLPGLGNVAGVIAWFRSAFEASAAQALLAGNAGDLLSRATGAGE